MAFKSEKKEGVRATVLPTAGGGSDYDDAPTFVAMSRFKVANGPAMTTRVKEAFRLNLVDSAPGFLRMDVISPLDDPDEVWLLTYWEDEESFTSWHHSHLYSDSHKGIPKGLKLVRGSFDLRFFEYVSS